MTSKLNSPSVQTEKAISNSPEPFRQIWWPVGPVICLYMFHISEHCSKFFKRSLTFQTFQPFTSLWWLTCLIVLKLNLFKTSQCLFWGQNGLNWMILLYINSYQLLSTPLDSRHCQILRMKFPALEMFQCHVATLPRGLPMSSGTFLWRSKDGRCRRRSWSRWSYLKNHTERRSYQPIPMF